MNGLEVFRSNEVRVGPDDPGARDVIARAVARGVGTGVRVLTILCIGSDRATGDCLGPLVGSLLEQGGLATRRGADKCSTSVEVIGSLDHPVHAGNLERCLTALSFSRDANRIVAVDASLGQLEHVGTVAVAPRPLWPGAAVHKALPPVGDVQVTGTVNVSGFMELAVLQNTRLGLVMSLAQLIADGLCAAVTLLSGLEGLSVSEGGYRASSPEVPLPRPRIGLGRLSPVRRFGNA